MVGCSCIIFMNFWFSINFPTVTKEFLKGWFFFYGEALALFSVFGFYAKGGGLACVARLFLPFLVIELMKLLHSKGKESLFY